jgi:hypothetical protein
MRVASHQGRIYIDLADEKWQAIEVGVDGWRTIDSPPVRFQRTPTMRPLPEPIRGGDINELRTFINVRDNDEFVLTVAWLLAALRDTGPYPVLVLTGEQGTAKSSMCRFLRDLVDPRIAPLRTMPKEDRDLFIAARNGHVLVFDNVSGLRTWLSDTLCRLSTGGGLTLRTLYTDADETVFDIKRPVILNGIEDAATRPDLIDRALLLSPESIPEDKRREEGELTAAFERARSRILGALLDAMVHGLGRLPYVKLARLPRMADFAVWATACETAHWPSGTFASAYEANRQSAVGTTIEADMVARAVTKLTEDIESWSGTASSLLSTLGDLLSDTEKRDRDWPTQPNQLSGRLQRIAPNMRKVGISVAFARLAGTGGAKLIQIDRKDPLTPVEEGAKSSTPPRHRRQESNINGLAAPIRKEASTQPAPTDTKAEGGASMGVDGSEAINAANSLKEKRCVDGADDGDVFPITSLEQSQGCEQCQAPADGSEREVYIDGQAYRLHPQCEQAFVASLADFTVLKAQT